jgi:outer membrane protein assembly factor BamB
LPATAKIIRTRKNSQTRLETEHRPGGNSSDEVNMKNAKQHVAAMVLLVLVLNLSCDHSTAIVSNGASIPSQMPQVDIPWPSLANSPWPMYLHDPQHTGRSPYRGPQEGKVEWRFETGNSVYSSPAIAPDGTMYFGSNDGHLYATNSDGSLKWKYKADFEVSESSPLVAADGLIYFSAWNASTNCVYALFPDGSLCWRAEGPVSSITPAISMDGEAIYCSGMKIFSLSAKTGEKKWELAVPGARTPVITPTGETIYWGSADRNLYATDAEGKIKWKFHLEEIPSTGCVDNEGNVYFNAGFYCYALAPDSRLRWKYETGGTTLFSSPSIGKDGTIYTLGGGGSVLYALNYAGKLKWKFELATVGGSQYGKRSENTPIIDVDGTIYLGTLTERIETDTLNFIALNPEGTLKYAMGLRSPKEEGVPERYRTPDIDSTPAISMDGHIYVGSDRPRGFHLYKVK